jgi:thiamine biosynthesis lipoprotein
MTGGGGGLWLAGLVGVALAPGAVATHDEVFGFQFDVLGAPANFLVTAMSRQTAHLAVTMALAEIERLDALLSGWRPDSELSRLNASREMSVSSDLFAVLEMAEDLRRRTGGVFNAGLGAVEALWRCAPDALPDPAELRLAAARAAEPVGLDPASRTVLRPAGVVFAIDALAKGYIVDRALAAACTGVPPQGMMIEIGGDARCRGRAGAQLRWPVGLPDPRLPFVNAPLVGGVRLHDQAIATSGRGPRDRVIGGAVYSPTLSAATGWAVTQNLSATVVAPTAAEADGLATALLAMEPDRGLALAAQFDGVEGRVTTAGGAVLTTPGWARLDAAQALPALIRPAAWTEIAQANSGSAPRIGPTGWVSDWALQVFFQAPPVNLAGRAAGYREPYMAMWISDKQSHPVRTLVMVGKDPQYQKDNYIWWSLYGGRAPKLVEVRSTGTALSGSYPTFWPGYNDDYKFLAAGEYLLNIESSREGGQHTFRSIPIILGTSPFEKTIPPTADKGEVTLIYGKQPS